MKNIEHFDNQIGLINLILYIHRKDKSNISDIRNKANINMNTAYKCLDIMDNLGLVESKEEYPTKVKRGFKSKNYYLTGKGKKVAEKLVEIEAIIEA